MDGLCMGAERTVGILADALAMLLCGADPKDAPSRETIAEHTERAYEKALEFRKALADGTEDCEYSEGRPQRC